MKGQLLIDRTDAYTSLGICVTRGSYNNLVAFPAMKEPDKNDWPEEDGKEFDLTTPTLNTAEVSIEFAYIGSLGIGGLIDILSDLSYHEFYFPLIDRSYKLRLSSQSSYVINPGLEVAKFILVTTSPEKSITNTRSP